MIVGENEWYQLTLVRLADVVLSLHLSRFAGLLNNKCYLHLGVEANVRITDDMQHKGVVTGLRRGGELSLESVHVESRVTLVVDDGLVKLGKVERRDGHLALLGVAEEGMPLGRVIAGVVGGKSQRREDGLLVNMNRLAVRTLNDLLLATAESLNVVLGGINVLEIQLINSGDVLSTRRDEAALDDEGHKRRGDDETLSSNLEESLGDTEVGNLLGNTNGGRVLLLGQEALTNSKLSSLSIGSIHELLYRHVGLGVALNATDNRGGDVGKLEKRR